MAQAVLVAGVAWLAALFAVGVVVLVRARSPFVRILVVDTLVALVVAFLLLLAIGQDQTVFVDAALALSLVGFATTVALVRVEREGREGPEEDAQ